MRAHVLGDRSVQATFIPSDLPRRSKVGFWAPDGSVTLDPDGPDEVANIEMLHFEEDRFTLKTVEMTLLPVLDATRLLIETDPSQLSPSASGLRSTIRHALVITARAEMQPSLTATGVDTWKLGPLTAADTDHFDAIARALPSEAWATTNTNSARETVDALATSVVDALVRTPAAPVAAGHRAFASMAPTVVDAQSAVRSFEMSSDQRAPLPVLRLVPPQPGSDNEGFVAALGLQSRGENARVLDMEAIWRAPSGLRDRFASVETALLITLRRAAKVWPPIQGLLDQQRPDRIELTDDDVDSLLGSVGRDLGAAGLSVLVAGELLRSIDLTAVVRAAPRSGSGNSRFDLSSVMQLDWRAAIDGQNLSEEELMALAETKRPLIRFRGEWVRVDSQGVRRLRERRTVGASAALAAALGAHVEIDGEAELTVEGPMAALADRLKSLDAQQEIEPPATLQGELRPYQRRGLAWLTLMADLGLGGVLADDMGLGKTIQVIALHLQRQPTDAAPMLVICPASVVGNWEREVKRFAPSLAVHRYHGQSRKLGSIGNADVVLTTYGVARRDAEQLSSIGWGLVIADEAQAIKNPYSRTAKALRKISGQARFALTGTPVQNHLIDLWAILDWTTPGLLGSLERFRRDLATPIERDNDPEVAEQLNRLLRPFVLRRTKADPTIVPDLPPKTETDEIVPLTTEQAALYQAVVTEVMAEIAEAEGIERKGLVLRLITRLKQVCNHPEHLLGEGGELEGRSGKLTAATALLDTISGEGQAALVFTQYVTMAELLQRHFESRGLRTRFLHGGLSLTHRQELVDQFQAGEADVFLLSLRAGGIGLNLTRATHVIHYDRWWNPAVEDQASDRAWRIGQDQPVQIHRMICEGTIEDRIAALLTEKRQLAETVIGSGEGWISDLTDDDLADLVSLSDPEGSDVERIE